MIVLYFTLAYLAIGFVIATIEYRYNFSLLMMRSISNEDDPTGFMLAFFMWPTPVTVWIGRVLALLFRNLTVILKRIRLYSALLWFLRKIEK